VRFADTTLCERVHRFEIGRLERLCPEPQHHWRRSRCLTRPLPGSHLGAFGKVDRRIEDHQVAALHPSVDQNLAAEVTYHADLAQMHHAILRSVWLLKKSNGSNPPLQENILSHPFTIALQSTYNGIVCYDNYNIKIIPTCRNRDGGRSRGPARPVDHCYRVLQLHFRSPCRMRRENSSGLYLLEAVADGRSRKIAADDPSSQGMSVRNLEWYSGSVSA
jgi:hypothetical protein